MDWKPISTLVHQERVPYEIGGPSGYHEPNGWYTRTAQSRYNPDDNEWTILTEQGDRITETHPAPTHWRPCIRPDLSADKFTRIEKMPVDLAAHIDRIMKREKRPLSPAEVTKLLIAEGNLPSHHTWMDIRDAMIQLYGDPYEKTC